MQKAFTPITLRNLTIRNRFIKTATNEGMWIDGLPSQQLIEHHARLAQGGIGMTTVAYGAVHPDGPSRILNNYGLLSGIICSKAMTTDD